MKSNCHRAFGAAAAFFLGFGASAALADGYYVGSVKDAAPVPAPVAYEWNGFSVGAGIGVGRFDQNVYGDAWREDKIETFDCTKIKWLFFIPICIEHEWKHQPSLDKDPSLQASSNDTDWSAFGTVQVGYDRLIQNRFLLGAFADLDFYNDSHASFSSEKKKNWLTGDVEREHSWTIGGRLGYLITPRLLLYGLAGYSQMKLEGNLAAHIQDPYLGQKEKLATNSDLGLTIKDRVEGWTIGAGLETKLERRLSLKLEYRYSQFDGISASTSNPETTEDYWIVKRRYSDGARLNLGDTDVHSVRAVLSFKLGRDEEQLAPLK